MNPIRVLVVDDDSTTRELIAAILRSAGMQAVSAENGKQALETLRTHPSDVVLLDVMMPVMDGLEACRRIRWMSDIPILLLTAKGEEQDVVVGLEMGANDYIAKPFRNRELVARINAAIHNRHAFGYAHRRRQLRYQNLILDLDAHRVVCQGKYVEVSPLEFQLLQYLMAHPGIVLSKEDLLRNVWGHVELAGNKNLIEAAVRRLRKKLSLATEQSDFIQTVWGSGYRLGE